MCSASLANRLNEPDPGGRHSATRGWRRRWREMLQAEDTPVPTDGLLTEELALPCSSRKAWSSASHRTTFRSGDRTCGKHLPRVCPQPRPERPGHCAVCSALARAGPAQKARGPVEPRRGSLGDPFSTSEGRSANCLGFLTAAPRTETVPKYSRLK